MEQLTQELKSGKMEILQVPFPIMSSTEILVRNHYSVISAGTESKTVGDARKGYIAKARSRQKEVKLVLNSVRTDGLKKTYDLVMNKLNAPSALGYSCAGQVIAVGSEIKDIQVGDAACGGSGAVHAEVVCIPRNLCVLVPQSVDISHAAFTTIAAIAIQGIRQADLRFGENCVIIGLGLIGQLAIQILKASGIKAIGIDINLHQVELARKNGATLAMSRDQVGLVETIKAFTNGHGTDSVIITAGTSSLDPVELAGELCRRKGRVVIVGAVPTGFSRPNYYRKELELKMATSYGPGRYDGDYELKGRDYPIGYVRFTENRNMQTFVDFLNEKKINMQPLISHRFDLHDAPKAYQMILDRSEPFTGILIKYDIDQEIKRTIEFDRQTSASALNIGFVGAGSFAQNAILPRIREKCNFVAVATAEGNMSRYVADKYGFSQCVDDGDSVVNHPDVQTIFVVTRHNLHAEFVIKALEAGKNVFVEKPLAMNEQELEAVQEAYQIAAPAGARLFLGFNRRFSPLTQRLKNALLPEQTKSILIRVNAGAVPPDHWVHDPEIGGGRIIGEACHFIDLAMYLAGSPITCVSAVSRREPLGLKDSAVINLAFENGSIASVNYFSNGSKSLAKEYIEVFCEGTVFIIDDFITLSVHGDKMRTVKLKGQDKGHSAELDLFIDSIKQGSPMPISFDEIYLSSLVTLKAIESMTQQRTIKL